jgi:C4-dicarboxylate-specific signal transduction histidine kinase
MARPLRQQILAVSIAISLVVVAAIHYASRLTYEEELNQLQDETRAMASVFVAYLDRHLATVDAAALAATRHPAVQQLDASRAVEVLEPLVAEAAAPLLRNAILADPRGDTIVWVRPPDAGVEGQLSKAWLGEVAAKRERAISTLLGGPGASAHAVLLAYPIEREGSVAGILGLAIHLEALEGIIGSVPLPPQSVITLADERSVVVARSLDAARYVGRPVEPSEAVLPPEEVKSTVVRVGVDGIERVFGNAVVSRGPWLASVGIPTSVAANRSAPIYRRNYAIALAASVLILGLSLLFARRLVRAMADVGRAAERVAQGDLSPLEPNPSGLVEIDQLQQSLVSMITKQREARDAIAAQVEEERRIRQEMISLQRQLIRQERLAAIGVLVSGVAHELNNPLQAILGFSELLQMQQNLPEQARADLTLIQRESARASAIIRNLSRFGRQTSEPSPVRLGDIVASVLELRQRKLEEQEVRLEVEDESEATVPAVFTELQQVVLNFVINAEQAVRHLEPESRRVKIRTSDARNSVRLEVEDYGNGVPSADEAKLFQPFFTTKPVGEGTGLGLSVSYGIITSHGGEIGYRRSHNGGAIFYFELPTEEKHKSTIRMRGSQLAR